MQWASDPLEMVARWFDLIFVLGPAITVLILPPRRDYRPRDANLGHVIQIRTISYIGPVCPHWDLTDAVTRPPRGCQIHGLSGGCQVSPLNPCPYSGVARISVRGEHFKGSAAWGVREAEPPEAGVFSKIFKNFLWKLLKCIILAYFPKTLTNHALIFRAFGRKTNFSEIFEIFQKIY